MSDDASILERAEDAREVEEVDPPRITAVVLAAGQSRRMGERNKLLIPIAGTAMVARVVDVLRASQVRDILVVTGHEAAKVRAALADRPVRTVHNPDHARGLSRSLAAGVAAARQGADVDGLLITLGDMPWIRPETVDALIAAIAGRPDAIAAPVHGGRRGNPVLWTRPYFDALEGLRGDTGARRLLATHANALLRVPVRDPGVLRDVDTPEMLRRR